MPLRSLLEGVCRWALPSLPFWAGWQPSLASGGLRGVGGVPHFPEAIAVAHPPHCNSSTQHLSSPQWDLMGQQGGKGSRVSERDNFYQQINNLHHDVWYHDLICPWVENHCGNENRWDHMAHRKCWELLSNDYININNSNNVTYSIQKSKGRRLSGLLFILSICHHVLYILDIQYIFLKRQTIALSHTLQKLSSNITVLVRCK